MIDMKMKTPPLTSDLGYDISKLGVIGEFEARGGQRCFFEDDVRGWAGLLGGPDRAIGRVGKARELRAGWRFRFTAGL